MEDPREPPARLSGSGWVFDPSEESLDFPGAVDLVYPIVHDHQPPDAVRRALHGAVDLVHRYPHREREAREAIGAYLGVPAASVLPTVGGNGALDLVARAFLQGRTVVVPVPAFWQIALAPDRQGCRLVTPDLLGPDPAGAVLDAFSRADAIVLCSPNNPTGAALPDGLVPALLERSRGRPVVVDESYADMAGTTFAASPMPPDLVLVRGLKTFLVPGARVGYVVAAPERIRTCALVRPPFEGGVFAEAAVLGALSAIDEIREIWRRVRADLRHLEASLLALGGRLEPSSTLFACWRHPEARRIVAGLRERGIFVLGPDSGVVHGMPADMMRLTARRREVTDAVVAEIARLV